MPGYLRKRWRRALLALLLLITGFAVFLALDIYIYSFATDPAPADAAIVLGTEAWGDRPSPVFEERIKHAIDLYRSGQVRALIMTGGQGPHESAPESFVASRFAVARGVAKADIYCETRSTITYDNLRAAKAIVEQEHLGRVLLVSDPMHMRRAMTMARDLGLDAYPSPTPTSRYRSMGSQMGFLLDEVRVYAGYLPRGPFLDKTPATDAVQPCQ